MKTQLAIGVLLWALAFFVVALGAKMTPVEASAPKPPPITQCPPVAQAGTILIYLCEPDNSPAFYQNSIGFPTLLP
jgi:hypothetical protein